MSDLMAKAVRQRPDLKAQAQRDAAEANITAARAAGRPTIQIGASHQFQCAQGTPNENYNTVGMQFSWPLFSGFNVTYGVRQAQAQLEEQEANLEQVGLTVSLDVWRLLRTRFDQPAAHRQRGIEQDGGRQSAGRARPLPGGRRQ